MLAGDAETITRKAIELAKSGDMATIRLCLDRIAPPCRDRPVTFLMPGIKTAADAVLASAAILSAVACGELTPREASDLGKLVDNCVRALEASELEQRLARLERLTTE
jgi:hypothetical protein